MNCGVVGVRDALMTTDRSHASVQRGVDFLPRASVLAQGERTAHRRPVPIAANPAGGGRVGASKLARGCAGLGGARYA